MDRQVRYETMDLECDGDVTERGKFSGMFKRSSKSSERSAPVQDNLSVDSELSASNDSLSENNNTKEKGGMFRGILKKSPKLSQEGTQAQAALSVEREQYASNHSLSDNSQEKTALLGGLFKRSPKPAHHSAPTQDNLSVGGELSASNGSLNDNNTKEKGGVFSGMFRKSPKPLGARTHSQDNLSVDSDLSASSDSLSEKPSKGGVMGKILRNPFSSSTQQDKGEKAELTSDSRDKPPSTEEQAKAKQDNLSVNRNLSASSDSLSEKPPKGGVMGKILRNPFSSSTQDKEKAEFTPDSSETTTTEEQSRTKQNGLSGNLKSPFYSDKQAKGSDSDSEEMSANGEQQSGHKQNKLVGAMTKLNPFRSSPKPETGSETTEETPGGTEKQSSNKQNALAGAMSKLNPFRSATKIPKDTEVAGLLKDNEKQEEEKPKTQVKSNLIHRERKDRTEIPAVPPRPTEEELKATATHDKLKKRETTEDNQACENMNARERKVRADKTPVVPLRATEEDQSGDESLKEGESLSTGGKREKEEEENVLNPADSKAAKVKKPKRHNPFMPRVVGKGKPILKKADAQQGATGSDTAENEGGNKSLFDKLEELRIDGPETEDQQDMDGLMEWWNTVEQWEDLPQAEDMTEKEEAKTFAVTADKVQKGIRVLNKLFSERAESLWQHVIDLNTIADGLDTFNKKTKIAQITGGSTSAIGGVTTITGLALAPVTMGASLIITAVGLAVATAGGLTSAGAGISNTVNNSLDRKKVEGIVTDYQDKMSDINKCMLFIKQGIENLRKFDLLKMKSHAYNRDFPGLNNIYEDGAMAGKAILINANEIMRAVQIANVAGSTAARAVQIASMATGVLTGLFVGMDIYFVAKDSKELKKGAKSEFAAKIRDVANQLHEGLVELNGIRDELQSTNNPDDDPKNDTTLDSKDKAKDIDYSDDDDDVDNWKKINTENDSSSDYSHKPSKA